MQKIIYIISILASSLGIISIFENRLIPFVVGLFILENLLLVLAGSIKFTLKKQKTINLNKNDYLDKECISDQQERIMELREELYEVENALIEKKILLEKEEAELEKKQRNINNLLVQNH
jgi:hypothetical protein